MMKVNCRVSLASKDSKSQISFIFTPLALDISESSVREKSSKYEENVVSEETFDTIPPPPQTTKLFVVVYVGCC